MLCDAGPLVALMLHTDHHHKAAVAFALTYPNEQFITTWSCLTEAMHLLGRHGGWRAQKALFEMIDRELLDLYDHRPTDVERMEELMAKFADAPMDLADASLITAAESLKETTIFSFDRHFHIYLLNDQTPVNVVP